MYWPGMEFNKKTPKSYLPKGTQTAKITTSKLHVTRNVSGSLEVWELPLFCPSAKIIAAYYVVAWLCISWTINNFSASTLLILAGRMSHMNLKKWPSSAPVSYSSLVRAPNQYLGGHGFTSSRGLRIVSLSHACDKWTYHESISPYVSALVSGIQAWIVYLCCIVCTFFRKTLCQVHQYISVERGTLL